MLLQNKEIGFQMQIDEKIISSVTQNNKKLLRNIGKTSRFCECGRLFTFKVRTRRLDLDYYYFDKCQKCRGLQTKQVEQKLYCVYKSKPKAIPNKPDKKRIQRRDVEVKISTRVREETKSDPRGLHLF